LPDERSMINRRWEDRPNRGGYRPFRWGRGLRKDHRLEKEWEEGRRRERYYAVDWGQQQKTQNSSPNEEKRGITRALETKRRRGHIRGRPTKGGIRGGTAEKFRNAVIKTGACSHPLNHPNRAVERAEKRKDSKTTA